MAMRRWNELSLRSRRVIMVGGVVEAVLKIAALVDLAGRPAVEVRGSKRAWALAIVLINSGGVLPLAYFRRGHTNRSGDH